MSRAVVVRAATMADLDSSFAMLQDSYDIEAAPAGTTLAEDDTTTVAFKLPGTKRYTNNSEYAAHILAGNVFVAHFSDSEECIGCIVRERDGEDRLAFGPFAVSRAAQRQGVGSALLEAVNQDAKRLGCSKIVITVVNYRTDVLPAYMKMGFLKKGTETYPRPHECARPAFFYVMEADVPMKIR